MRKNTLLAVAIIVAGAALAASPAVAVAPEPGSPVRQVDTAALHVLYNGKTLTSAEAADLQARYEAEGREFVIVFDPVSARTGVAHAFDSAAEADAFDAAGMVRAHSAQYTSPELSASVTPAATCPDAKNISRMYWDTACGGSVFAWLLTDNEPALSEYGWANKASSLVVGHATSGCIILIRLYPGPNYTYTEARFYGDTGVSTYYNFNGAQNDNFESGRSTCS